ncbi:MAG: LemA family protein [Pseudodesulfovibrio sp.]|uniref:LemA family protein n=1 Tax=Pseudodesulfovibrio aespoeensis (strain ATCC 700646 / DSM 10631 / Aspo-2) TaxID=643562 RepID=E6VTY8_PSEA9|nr:MULTISPECIES: LemA family protein [Pseudodesulfovibrio]MBU4244099.1 LemA family protein [Pseudomonadota bacterium]ADU61080.1 LemA family protein [Pseudodesulfovibrio aespoeensis Aspo-2]MBU4379314.1 LemA family protein [Pseudomonadota bacterium]MBU4476460.1 LemA family protein [Pseudomonadota bacterium]MBU4517454.1 LemA family protein [Pseudomonadota bacterium]
MFKRFFSALAALVVVMSLAGCGYNALQQQEETVFAAWGDLEATLQRRADLIPNLVETVKGAAAHERETLQAVIDARAKATQMTLSPEMLTDKQALANFQAAQGEISSALSRLMVVVERYPDLKANQNYLALQHQLEGTENRINVARQRYNDAVRAFNGSIRSFPNSLTNSLLLHLERKEFFQADPGAKAAPAVSFGTQS